MTNPFSNPTPYAPTPTPNQSTPTPPLNNAGNGLTSPTNTPPPISRPPTQQTPPPPTTQPDNLPQQLTQSQFQDIQKQLVGQGAPQQVVQKFADSYQTKDYQNYTLKTEAPAPVATPTPTTGDTLVKNNVLGANGGKLFDSLTSGLQNVGQDIGHAIQGKTDAKTIQSYATNAATLTDLASKQTDPALKQKYSDMATQMLKDGQQAGLDLKGRTPEQIVGDVLSAGVETAGALSLGLGAVGLAGGGAVAEGVAGQAAKTIGQKIVGGAIQGAKIGGGFGATQGVATGLQNKGNAQQVIQSGLTGGVEGAAGGAVIGAAVPAVIGGTPKIGGAIKEAVSPSLTSEEQVGKIIQGKTADIPAATRTFNALPTGVNPAKMTPQELSTSIQDNIIQKNLDAVDTHFANDNTLHPMSDFVQKTGTGKGAVKMNYVQQAIDQLKTFYAKTNDAQGLSDMLSLEEKATTKGLSSQELNNLAKEHGTTINAFNANGEAASGLSKQAAENTRTGVKATAREMLAQSDPQAAKAATVMDKQTADAIRTKNLLDKQAEKGAVKIQKSGKPSAISKFAKAHPITSKVIGKGLKVAAGAALGKEVGGTTGEVIGGALGGGI